MKRKVCIQSECKLSTRQKNKALKRRNGKKWLVIKRHFLSCIKLHQVGVILVRHDLVELMKARLADFFPEALPVFQVELLTLYREKESLPVY
jgi:hypothetical protein